MARTALPIAFSVEGELVRGETLYTDAGAFVLVLTSSSAALGIELRSAYLEGERSAEVLVAESAVVGAQPAELRPRLVWVGEGALTDRRRALLYDHLQALQDLAAQAGHGLGIDGLDLAAALLDPHTQTDLSA